MASGGLLEAYLSRFGVAAEGISVETIGFAAALDAVARVDASVAGEILRELADQRTHLKLIASENFASPPCCWRWATGSATSTRRALRVTASTPGCDNVDAIEPRVDELACELFGADHAYVQPHSGIDANLVAFWAVLSATSRVTGPAALGVRHVERPRGRAMGARCGSTREPDTPRHVAGRRRPPHSRLPAQHLGQALPPSFLRGRSRNVAARLRRGPAPGPRRAPADPLSRATARIPG